MSEPQYEFFYGAVWNLDRAGGELEPGKQFDEQADLMARFTEELAKPTGDGKKKRTKGAKPPWYEDDSHWAAVFSHITKYLRGELVDPDSGAHPLVHASWRLLAIACRETGNVPLTNDGYPDTMA